RALHQELLPGDRVRARRPDHAPGRRADPDRRPRDVDGDLPPHHRALFRHLARDVSHCSPIVAVDAPGPRPFETAAARPPQGEEQILSKFRLILRSARSARLEGEAAWARLDQYATETRYNPSGGASGAQALRSRAARTFTRSSPLHRPSPTKASEPTIERTCVCRKERAAAWTWISAPSRATSRRSSVFTGDCAWHSAARNVVKSWRPSRRCAASCIAAASSGRAMRQARPRSSARSARRLTMR